MVEAVALRDSAQLPSAYLGMNERDTPAIQNGRRLHRRGLSLDQGMNRRQLHGPNNGPQKIDWTSWLDIEGKHNAGIEIQRPSTPVEQASLDQLLTINSAKESFLLTPATTPGAKRAHIPRNCKTAHPSPTKKPPPRLLPRQPEQMTKSTPCHGISNVTSPGQTFSSFEDFPSLQYFDQFGPKIPELSDDVFKDFTFHSTGNSDTYAICAPTSPTAVSISFSSELPKLPLPTLANRRKKAASISAPIFAPNPKIEIPSACSSPIRAALISKAVSIADLKLDSSIDASVEETGITLEDICAYIGGPEPEDNKWVCVYDGCFKRFGRKENIKSHVQTHLGDRQYKCNHCKKSFVRGHDLKRHAKIHTGVKPYPCECGNSFARHDALTRHKQRGMCTGAFAGIVKRPERRGRPKKKVDERREKVMRTRRRVAKKESSPSSPELSSCTSLASPISERFESFDHPTSRQISPAKQAPFLDINSIALPPDVFTFTPPASPSYSRSDVSSPGRSYQSSSVEPELLCLSPSKRYLDDIPEIPELPPIASGSPTPVKREFKAESKVISPARILWPSSTESLLPGYSGSNEFDDVFASHHAQASNFDHLPPLGPPSLASMSESSASQYDDDLFVRQLNGDEPDLTSEYFSFSLSPTTDAFFDRFSNDITK
ncbi:Metallothionein expression activator [Myotisia sp. PD_48]|nr:Metallothionein expression activator [Myotisia sp. PD_48]